MNDLALMSINHAGVPSVNASISLVGAEEVRVALVALGAPLLIQSLMILSPGNAGNVLAAILLLPIG